VLHRLAFGSLSVLLLVGATGCGAYRRKPIADRQVLRDLQTIRLEGLGILESKRDENAPKIDAAKGLSVDEAVAVGLYLNPDLRAFRKERGVVEGELVSARLLPNPEIQASALWNLFGAGGGIGSGGVSALVAPFRAGERGARIARAQARIEETKSQISAQEWKLAADVRKAYSSVWALEEQVKIDDAAVRLQERVLKFFREKRQLGDASRLDLNLVNIEYTQALRQREVSAGERDRTRQSLLELLGLPPLYELSLKQPSDPIAYQAFHLDPAALESLMIERRPQLAAAKQEYEQAEQDLRLAYIQRIPWFRLGPSYERESGGGEGTVDRLGAGLGLDLPLFNRNQGAIASLEANRDKLREGFIAKVHTARAELNESYRNLRAQERLIHLYQDAIKPALDENVELTESGFQLREFDLVQLITTQDKVLKARRDFVSSELEYWMAATDLELAIGARLSEAEKVTRHP
jgi:cobalt-zinc-cadmium efflux system outer membrane protein